jgi:hypothetical protein
MEKEKGLIKILLIFVVVGLIGVIYFVASRPNSNQEPPQTVQKLLFRESFKESSNLPKCNGQQFTTPIVDINEIKTITPLGNFNPPDHILPTEHTYIHLKRPGVSLVAPADITVTNVSSNTNPEGQKDYSIQFALCKEIFGYFIHIKTLENDLASFLDNANCSKGAHKHCWAEADLKLKAGQSIGTVGASFHNNFDFGAYDMTVTVNYANPKRYTSRSPNIVCPYDYYSQPFKNQLMAKLERTTEPRCGQTSYDVAGTLQGNWFFGNVDANTADVWDKHLTFGYSNFDPSIAVVSIGGVFTNASIVAFTPNKSGLVNRKFDQITSDGKTYCFESEDTRHRGKEAAGKLLARLTSNTELQVEMQTGSCSNNESISNPTTYKR